MIEVSSTTMQSTGIFIILTYWIQFCWAGSEPLLHPHDISKRYLVYPYGDFDMKWVTNLKERRKRTLINIPQQTIFYSSVEDALTRHGLHGRSCVLNLICEISKDPHPPLTLYDELFRKLLLPSKELLDDLQYVEYLEATQAGKYGVDCNSLYEGCPVHENFISFLE